jgi:hypothetical protein
MSLLLNFILEDDEDLCGWTPYYWAISIDLLTLRGHVLMLIAHGLMLSIVASIDPLDGHTHSYMQAKIWARSPCC